MRDDDAGTVGSIFPSPLPGDLSPVDSWRHGAEAVLGDASAAAGRRKLPGIAEIRLSDQHGGSTRAHLRCKA